MAIENSSDSLSPPPDFSHRPLRVAQLPAARLIRIHRVHHDPLYFGKNAWYRFDDPKREYGVLYAAFELSTCFAETLLRDFFRKPLVQGINLIPLEELQSCHVTRLDTASGKSLSLADLTGHALQRLGGDARVTATTDYGGTSQLWSRAIWEHPLAVEGILYMSRYDNTQRAVALFERAKRHGLFTHPSQPLLSHPDLPAVLDKYEIGI